MDAAQKQPSSKLWQGEYEMGGIPSSHRATPSGAVTWMWEKLGGDQKQFRTAIDIGCGKGRNSLFLAEKGVSVTALDFTPNAIEALRASAKAHKLDDKIRAYVHDVTEGWPVKEHEAQLAIDTFCFKHIVGKEARQAYKENLMRALGTHDFYLISFASIGDGYYGKYIRTVDAEGQEAISVDPANGIESVIYSRDRVIEFFRPEFLLFAERYTDKPDVMHGETWQRQTYALILQKKTGLSRAHIPV